MGYHTEFLTTALLPVHKVKLFSSEFARVSPKTRHLAQFAKNLTQYPMVLGSNPTFPQRTLCTFSTYSWRLEMKQGPSFLHYYMQVPEIDSRPSSCHFRGPSMVAVHPAFCTSQYKAALKGSILQQQRQSHGVRGEQAFQKAQAKRCIATKSRAASLMILTLVGRMSNITASTLCGRPSFQDVFLGGRCN